jgi:hypothetical protein
MNTQIFRDKKEVMALDTDDHLAQQSLFRSVVSELQLLPRSAQGLPARDCVYLLRAA